jgi:hypothetical protein
MMMHLSDTLFQQPRGAIVINTRKTLPFSDNQPRFQETHPLSDNLVSISHALLSFTGTHYFLLETSPTTNPDDDDKLTSSPVAERDNPCRRLSPELKELLAK